MAYGYKVLLFVFIAGLAFNFQIPAVENFLLNTNVQFVQNQQEGTDDRAYWMDLANTAWQYYQPGVGVSSTTGLHSAHLNYQGFTDWDLGVYIQAVVDAAKLGIITNDDNWGFDYRIDKILTFLENRDVYSDGTPYTWYSSITGDNIDEVPQYAADAGNLLVALKNVELYRPWFADRVDNLVKNQTNYEPLRQAVDKLSRSVNIYDYYVTAAFATFWPERFDSESNIILNNIISAPTITYEDVTLPKAKLMCEPLLLAIFNLQPNANLMNLSDTVYLAHEARYNSTGNYVAFSEGNPAGVATHYIWEWVVIPDGQTWVTQKDEFNSVQMTPVVFLKAAVGLSALYNTQFTENMLNDMVPDLRTTVGYLEGKSETGKIISLSSDKTNGMILGAARYAIDNGTSAPNSTQPPIVTPGTEISPSPKETTSTNSSTTSNSTANPSITALPMGSVSPSSSATETLPNSSSSPSTSSSSPPTVDAFWLTHPIILAASAAAVFTLLLLVVIYRKRQTKQTQAHQTK